VPLRRPKERPLGGIGGTDSRRGKVDLEVALQVFRLDVDEVGADRQSLPDLPLDTGSQLMGLWILVVIVHGDDVGGKERIRIEAERPGDVVDLIGSNRRQRAETGPVEIDAHQKELPVQRVVLVAGRDRERQPGGDISWRL
jgi:hypothetical protein